MNPVELGELLYRECNRAGKTKVEGNRIEYRLAYNEPIVKQIVEKAKTLAEKGLKLKSLKPSSWGQESANLRRFENVSL